MEVEPLVNVYKKLWFISPFFNIFMGKAHYEWIFDGEWMVNHIDYTLYGKSLVNEGFHGSIIYTLAIFRCYGESLSLW